MVDAIRMLLGAKMPEDFQHKEDRRGLRADHRHLAVPSLGRAFRGPVPRCDGPVLPHRGVELQGNEERRLHQVTPTGLPGCFAWGGSEP